MGVSGAQVWAPFWCEGVRGGGCPSSSKLNRVGGQHNKPRPTGAAASCKPVSRTATTWHWLCSQVATGDSKAEGVTATRNAVKVQQD